ncbi:MAG: hypothetical protein R3B48_08250 [Kofleriaceae bacterium]
MAAGLALAIAAYFALTCRHYAGTLGFPLDDAYIYLTYAKQIVRGAPLTYLEGGGFSAGSTSLIWPWLLTPPVALGLYGNALVIGVWSVGVALLAITLWLAADLTRQLARLAELPRWAELGLGAFAMALVATQGALAWGYLSGMEIPLAGALLLACARSLWRSEEPSWQVSALLGAAALARPEAAAVVVVVVALWASRLARAGRGRQALLVAAALAPLVGSALLYRLGAGHWVPNTAVSKSHFFQPSFSWGYYVATVITQARALVVAVATTGPLTPAAGIATAYAIGAWRLLALARRRGRWLGACVLVLGPVGFAGAVLVSSGQWQFQNYRYLISAAPLLLVTASFALAPRAGTSPRPWLVALAAALGLVAWRATPALRAQARLYAQGVRDTQAQVVRVGQWVSRSLPPASVVALHDVGAIGYFGERRLFDVIGLITNGQARVCANGAGARFEGLERLPRAARPTHFIYYPGWLLAGSRDLFGEALLTTTLPPAVPGAAGRLVGGASMVVFQAELGLLGTGAAPLVGGPGRQPGWRLLDALDVADLVDEDAHGYRAELGARRFGDNTDRWSCYFRSDEAAHGSLGAAVADGGRTIRGGAGERFVLRARAGARHRLILRSGGPAALPWTSIPEGPRRLTVTDERSGAVLGALELPAAAARWSEAALELVAARDELRLAVRDPDGQPYRSFHYYLLVAEP